MGHSVNDLTLVYVVIAVLCAIIIGIAVAVTVQQAHEQEERRREVISSVPISAQDFLANWHVGGRNSGFGYYAIDNPGCYAILINSFPLANGDVTYDDVYVGQSIHVCQRVRQHLTGHGNGDVYADVREGKDVQVRIVPCSKSEMNVIERNLISAFHATDSYNRTCGGSRRR